MKKAQMEMMGLVLIIVIILIAGLFYLKFGVMNSEPKKEQTTIQSTQAFNLMNALINVNICEDKQLKDAIASCEQNPTGTFCENMNACQYLKEQIPAIIDPFMKNTIGIAYTFEAKKSGNVFLTFGNCETGPNSPPLRFTSSGKPYQAYFKLCKL